MNGPSSVTAALCGNCCGSPASAASNGWSGTCAAGGSGAESGRISSPSAALETGAIQATGGSDAAQQTPNSGMKAALSTAGVLVSRQLLGDDRAAAADVIRRNHYTHSVPSGKSHYVQFGDAIVVWSIPANMHIARFVLGWDGNVWELSRLWAPDGHKPNLLTQAISAAVKVIVRLERPDALVSYADPNAGHKGGVYRAASWLYHGKSEEVRVYLAPDGTSVARRAFHSGRKGLRKAEIEALGYREHKMPGKERFVRPISKRAARTILAQFQPVAMAIPANGASEAAQHTEVTG